MVDSVSKTLNTSSQATAVSPVPLPVVSDQSFITTAAKGGGIIFTGDVFLQGSRVLLGILMARLLGAEQLGLYNLAMTAAAVAAGLAFLGLGSGLVRYVSLFAGRRDTARLWGTLQVGLGLPAIVSLLMGVGLYALATPIAERLFHDLRLVPLLRLASLFVPFLTLSNIIAAATRGFKKMQYTVIAQSISQPIARLVLIGGLAIAVGLSAANALAAFGLTSVMVVILLLYFLNKLFPLKRPIRSAQRNTRELLRFSLPIYSSGLINTFGGNIQSVLLGALNTVASVGIFAVASQINTIGRMFHGAIVTSSMPIVSELYDRGEREQLGRFYQVMTKWTFTVNLPLFLFVLLFPVPVLSIFGQDFVGGATALVILAWGNLVNTGTGICGVILDMTGNTMLKLVNSLMMIALTLGLNVLLIPTWGLAGAAVASLAAAAGVNLLRLVEVFVLFRLLPYNRSFVKPVVAGLVSLIIPWAIRWLSPPEPNLIYTIVSMVTLLAVYGGMIPLLGLSQEDRTVLARITRRIYGPLKSLRRSDAANPKTV